MRGVRRDGMDQIKTLEKKGEISEDEFIARLEDGLESILDHRPHLHHFRRKFWGALHPNEEMIALMHELKDSGLKMAMLTNNVREWEPLWRAMLPVDGGMTRAL